MLKAQTPKLSLDHPGGIRLRQRHTILFSEMRPKAQNWHNGPVPFTSLHLHMCMCSRCRHLFSHSQDSHCAKQIFFSSLSEVRHVISLVLYIKRYKHVHACTCVHSTTYNCMYDIYITPLPSKRKKKRRKRKNNRQGDNSRKIAMKNINCALIIMYKQLK